MRVASDPMLLKAAFLFLLVGYGTKAGLAPMHSWLPDAHSQAPAPVSALFSGFMLNAALYCIMRYMPLVESTSGHCGLEPAAAVLFGLVSILVAAAFIIFQHDVKRLLAYHSVEHHRHYRPGPRAWGPGHIRRPLPHAEPFDLQIALVLRRRAPRPDVRHARHDQDVRSRCARRPVWGTGLFGSSWC